MDAEGDQRAESSFEECFDAHHAELLAFAVRRVDGRAAAEDAVAETFAVAWRRRDSIPDPALPWLYGVARRVIANQQRSARRRRRLWDRLSRERRPAEGSPDPTELVGERDAVLSALSRLSEGQREVLMLVAWEGLDAPAAAEVLGCSPAAFRMRLHRARRELERQLDGDAAPASGRVVAQATSTTTLEETR